MYDNNSKTQYNIFKKIKFWWIQSYKSNLPADFSIISIDL